MSITLLIACNGEDALLVRRQKARLHGTWLLKEGYRNDRLTETLKGVYFRFDSAGTMQTNLPVSSEDVLPFTLTDSTLTQKINDQTQARYVIGSWTDTSMVMRIEHHGITLRMHLGKQIIQ